MFNYNKMIAALKATGNIIIDKENGIVSNGHFLASGVDFEEIAPIFAYAEKKHIQIRTDSNLLATLRKCASEDTSLYGDSHITIEFPPNVCRVMAPCDKGQAVMINDKYYKIANDKAVWISPGKHNSWIMAHDDYCHTLVIMPVSRLSKSRYKAVLESLDIKEG